MQGMVQADSGVLFMCVGTGPGGAPYSDLVRGIYTVNIDVWLQMQVCLLVFTDLPTVLACSPCDHVAAGAMAMTRPEERFKAAHVPDCDHRCRNALECSILRQNI